MPHFLFFVVVIPLKHNLKKVNTNNLKIPNAMPPTAADKRTTPPTEARTAATIVVVLLSDEPCAAERRK